MKLNVMSVTLLLGLGTVIHAQQYPLGPILLDNFSQGDRPNPAATSSNNGVTPPIWSDYLGEDPNQVFSVTNGEIINKSATEDSNGVADCTSNNSTVGCDQYVQFMPYPYVPPSGHMQNWILSGTWSPEVNRMRFRMTCDTKIQPVNSTLTSSYTSDPEGTFYVGTYIKPLSETNASNQGQHYYHTLGGGMYPGHWTLVEINTHPNHEVGGANQADLPNDPEWANPSEGAPVHYFDGMTRFYIASTQGIRSGYSGGGAWAGATCQYKDFYLDTDTTESPDDLVSNITATYNGSQYEVTWNGQQMQNTKYTVYYSTKSMKTNGLGAGTQAGAAIAPGSGYPGDTQTAIAIPSSYSSTGMYFAIQPAAGSNSAVCGYPCFTEVYLPPFDTASSGSGSGSTTSNPCDLNGDGVVNQTDVNLAITASLKGAATPNLDGTGKADVVDVQRIVNASLGGTCRTGP